MSENKQYENEYKVQAVKLARKIGAVNAANELQINECINNTLALHYFQIFHRILDKNDKK